jgi:multisubunit Na+/H+ antiporter MnhE subunit
MTLLTWVTWVPRILWFLLWAAGSLVRAQATVTLDTLTRPQRSSPVIFSHRTRCRDDLELAALCILISITPGTLVLATRLRPSPPSEEGSAGDVHEIYVHAMYGELDKSHRSLNETERRLLNAWRRRGLDGGR